MMRPSLNRRLVLRLAAGIVLVWCLATAWMAWRSLHEIDEIFDQMLVRTAASIFAVMPTDASPGVGTRLRDKAVIKSDRSAQRPAITVRDSRGELLISNDELPALQFNPDDPPFHTINHDKRRWRVFQRTDSEKRYWIQIAAPLDERDELMRKLLAPALLALLGLLLMLPPIVFIGLRGGLQPLRKLTRSLGHTTTPLIPTLTDARVPSELAPFTRAIDRLVARLRESLESERRFTADAAHELRHPLAIMRLELEIAERSNDETERNLHLQRAHMALDRMQRLVTQLLMLARVDQLTELDDAGPLHLGKVVESVLRDTSERAAALAITLSLDHDGDDRVEGSRGLLEILVQNLLDNALRHTPAHGEVNLRIEEAEGRVTLRVNDSGSGFAEEDVAKLAQRFHRPEGSLGEGSGLGLSIAQGIGNLHHGSLAFGRSPLGGAQVSFSLPLAPLSTS
ncbi:MAG: ATP-binding protein [Dokdonella sp.]